MAPLIFASTRRYLFHIKETHSVAAKGVGGEHITYSFGNRGYSISHYLFPGRGVGLGWCRVRCSRRTLVPCRSATYCWMVAPVGPAQDPDVGVEPLRWQSDQCCEGVEVAPGACSSILLHQRPTMDLCPTRSRPFGASHRAGGVGPRRGLRFSAGSARGSSPLLARVRIAGSRLARQEVHDKVVATVGAVGRSGVLRTGNGRRFRSVGHRAVQGDASVSSRRHGTRPAQPGWVTS